MRTSKQVGLLILLLVTLPWLTHLKADDQKQDFAGLKRTLYSQLKSGTVEERVNAVHQLAEAAGMDAAKLILQVAVKNREPQVRQAGYETLLKFKEDEEVCDFLFGSLLKEAKKKNSEETAVGLLAVLLSSDTPAVQQKVLKFLNERIADPKGGLLLAVTLADILGMRGDVVSVGALERLAGWDAFQTQFAVRRSVIQALTQIKQPEAVEALIRLLGEMKGEVRADIVAHLTRITRQQHGVDANAWKQWWEGNKATFKFPNDAELLAGQEMVMQAASSYYGLPLYGVKLVFILDTSRSMIGPRLMAAKRELINAIQKLPTEVSFAVLVFNSTVTPWQKQLMQATPEAKQSAARFVESQEVNATTASYDALEAAFNYDAESIYFLTDGAPHGGKVTNPTQIVALITQANRVRRLSINSIGIGVGPEGSVFDTFLKTLAAKNFGAYRRVDQ